MRLYKHHITPLLQVLLVLCAFATLASCVSDKFWEQLETSRNPEPETTPYYLSFKIMGTSGESIGSTRTRSSEFEDGSDLEHKVGDKGNYVILLNGNKSLYGVYPLLLYKVDENYADDDTREAVYTTRFYHDESKDLPEYGLVVLNANDGISKWLDEELKGSDESTILKKIWTESSDPKKIGFGKGDGNNPELFTMTNSAYVEDNAVKVAAEIKGRIAKSIEEAWRNRVTVYVERMVAKFELIAPQKTFEGTGTLPFFSGYSETGALQTDDRKWQITITGWGINALETGYYLFKNITNTAYFSNESFSNSASLFRSFWSEDPHYNGIYPWQYRMAVDYNLKYYKNFEDNNTNLLRNYSYNDFYNETHPLTKDEEDENKREDNFNRYIYVPENTYGPEVLNADYDSRTNLLAGTHLILCAQLEVDINGDGNYVTGDWYRDRAGTYYKSEKDCIRSFVHDFNKTLTSQGAMKFTHYKWNTEGSSTQNLAATTANNGAITYKLYYNNQELTENIISNIQSPCLAPATIQHGDGKVFPWFREGTLTIQVDEDNSIALQITEQDEVKKKEGEAGYETIPGDEVRSQADSDDIKSLLYEWLGSFDHFQDGKMYYAAPVLHNGINNPSEANQKILGDYGVVRNHWYQFTLTDIKAIGIPVDDSEQPIVPDCLDIYDMTNSTIKLIPWHEETTTVPLPW